MSKYDPTNEKLWPLCSGQDHVAGWWLDSVWHEEPHDGTQAEPGSHYCEHCARNMEIHAAWEQERSDREHARVTAHLQREFWNS